MSRGWLHAALPIVAALTVLATVVAFIALDRPSAGFAGAILVSAIVTGAMGRRWPGPALVTALGLDFLFLAMVFLALLGQIGPGDCGTHCTEVANEWDAGHQPFFVIGAITGAAHVVLLVGAAIARATRAVRARA